MSDTKTFENNFVVSHAEAAQPAAPSPIRLGFVRRLLVEEKGGGLYVYKYSLDATGNPFVVLAFTLEDNLFMEQAEAFASAQYGFNGTRWDRIRALSDAADAQSPATLGALLSLARQQAFNGTTYDRLRNNTEGTVLASAVRNATTASPDQTNHNARGVHVTVNVTAAPGVVSITPIIEGKDPTSGSYYTIVTGTARTAVGTYSLRVYPGIAEFPGEKASDTIPRTWRVQIVHSGAGNFTYSVGSALIL